MLKSKVNQQISTLSGSGTQMVTVDNNGTFGKQPVPTAPTQLFWDDVVTTDMTTWAYGVNLAIAPTGAEIYLDNPGGTYRVAQTIIAGYGGPPYPMGTHNLGDFCLKGNRVTLNVYDDWFGMTSPSLPFMNDGVFYNCTTGPSANGPVCQPTSTMRIGFTNGGGIKQNGNSCW